MKGVNLTAIESILLLTAFSAGSVDVISFATLGGIFASAMTGNLALLAYYVARSDRHAALASLLALLGFVVGCALGAQQRRGRAPGAALSPLLASEMGLLLFFALCAFATPHLAHAASDHLQILLLAGAMGLQAVVGQNLSLTTIVFTSTLTKLVGAIADALAKGDTSGLKDLRIQSALVSAYVLGALLAGALIVNKIIAVVLLPCIAVAAAAAVHYRNRRREALGPK